MGDYKCLLCKSEATITTNGKDELASIDCPNCGAYRATEKNIRYAMYNPLSDKELAKVSCEIQSDPDYLLKNTLYF
ncbi:hypothetical protein AXG55_08155 [Silvanigrella aquatica]|uniref:Uncharacterized protein n=1 Tax=Silvanigrella aquatica TaxID=1915309 RepID=A0A1L4D122_9BACT|nr:hypothetical protein AXG55_08155 [Silvanigrella aquatica]